MYNLPTALNWTLLLVPLIPSFLPCSTQNTPLLRHLTTTALLLLLLLPLSIPAKITTLCTAAITSIHGQRHTALTIVLYTAVQLFNLLNEIKSAKESQWDILNVAGLAAIILVGNLRLPAFLHGLFERRRRRIRARTTSTDTSLVASKESLEMSNPSSRVSSSRNSPTKELSEIPRGPFNKDECTERGATLYQTLMFTWLTPLMQFGSKQPLTNDTLPPLINENKAKHISAVFTKQSRHRDLSFRKNSQRVHTPSRISLLKQLFRAFGAPFLMAGFLKFLYDCLNFTQPQLLNQLMKFIGNPTDPKEGYWVVGLMVLTIGCSTMIIAQYFHRCNFVGLRVRVALVTAIYRKSLRLSSASKTAYTTGQVVNLMAVDAQRFFDLLQYLHIVWSGPFQIGLACYFLYQAMGPSVFAGVGVLIGMLPLNAFIARRAGRFQKQNMSHKDSRMKIMDQVLSGIKVVKLYAWVAPMAAKIKGIREEELSTLKSLGFNAAAQNFTFSMTPFLVTFLSFAVYTLNGNTLDASKIFVAIALFNALQFPLMMFPMVISNIIETSISATRIWNFLCSEELADDVTHEPCQYAILCDNANFQWEADKPVLQNINMQVGKSELYMVVGSVGSGKTSLLSGLLGDLSLTSGSINVDGDIGYVSQSAWIMNATLRENICFGKPFEEDFYQQVISACSLVQDFAMLPNGDNTEIGERGINLSGGQKQRVNLARAVYARKKIYFLDDTLSAVDALVSSHIFQNVIGPTGMLKDTCRIFVTHAIQYLSQADQILLIQKGKILERGTFEDCMASKQALYTLVHEHAAEQVSASSPNDTSQDVNDPNYSSTNTKVVTDTARSTPTNSSGNLSPTNETPLMSRDTSALNLVDQKKSTKGPKDSSKLMTTEDNKVGRVDWSVYVMYLRSCSKSTVISVVLLGIFAQGLQVASNYWLKYVSGAPVSTLVFIAVYGALGVSSGLGYYLQNILLFAISAVRAARNLHDISLQRILRVPMSYYDTTPLGRIINRFSKDINTIDEALPKSFSQYVRMVLVVVSTATVISIQTPIFLALLAPLVIVYYMIQRYYIASSRELKRLDSSTKSPIFAHFSETLGGTSTIRAYGREQAFITQNELNVDLNSVAFYPSMACNRWLAVRLELVGASILFGATFFAVLSVTSLNGTIDPGGIGLSVSYALGVTQALNWLVRMYCDIETNIVSVERMKEFTNLDTEASEEYPEPNDIWPTRGVVQFKNYSCRYRQGLSLVLKGLTFSTQPSEKIGIVGRTGAGKSSLTLAIFRIVEAASGCITIDGQDIRQIGLSFIREAISIIPQDPWLFGGSLRENLDPFGRKSDSEMWTALRAAELGDVVGELPGKLDAVVAQGGENFSAGQRQLICLARALLRKSKVLIMDESTAAIDSETDRLIQLTIRKSFSDCTILTIAHRLDTVMDNDRILVLDSGTVAEYDTPTHLLANKKSIFYAMAKDAKLVA